MANQIIVSAQIYGKEYIEILDFGGKYIVANSSDRGYIEAGIYDGLTVAEILEEQNTFDSYEAALAATEE